MESKSDLELFAEASQEFISRVENLRGIISSQSPEEIIAYLQESIQTGCRAMELSKKIDNPPGLEYLEETIAPLKQLRVYYSERLRLITN